MVHFQMLKCAKRIEAFEVKPSFDNCFSLFLLQVCKAMLDFIGTAIHLNKVLNIHSIIF